jgi:hypothetical protein
MIRTLATLMIVMTIEIFTGCIMEEDQKLKIEFYPEEYEGDFPLNPMKGFVAWGESPDLENYSEPYSMIYARLYWAQVERKKGSFEWEEFESDWNFDKAIGNRKIVLRVVLDNPNEHLEGSSMEIPEWLFDETDGAGTHYDNPNLGEGFSPDYASPALIEEHKRFIAALGERYDKDPRIAFVQIGSLGHWGEWHTWPQGTGDFPKYAIAEKYIRHYTSAFKNKLLMVRRPLAIHSGLPTLGLFNDALGDDSATGDQSWTFWIERGYKSEWDKAKHPAMKSGWWKSACSGGELAAHKDGPRHWFEGDAFTMLLNQVKECHTSWIGPSGPGLIRNPVKYQPKIDTLVSTLGYRFVIEKAVCSVIPKAGGKLDLELSISNTGVAPFYYKWPFEVSISTVETGIVHSAIVDSVDIRSWVPGKTATQSSIRFPKELSDGDYEVGIAILNPDTREPGIEFANDRAFKRDNGRYAICTFSIPGK